MSSRPLLTNIDADDPEDDTGLSMPTKDDVKDGYEFEEVDGLQVVRPGSKSVPDDDPAAPSQNVSSVRQRISDLWTILCAGCALISDGYANSLMTMINVVLEGQYTRQYTAIVSTRVSNALLIGEICGQITIG